MNRRARLIVLLFVLFAPLPVVGDTSDLRGLIADGAEVRQLAGDFAFTEGPTADQDGNVFFVDQPNNRILKYDLQGNLTTFLQPSGYSNGLSFDKHGQLLAAADEKNELWSIDMATKTARTLVSHYNDTLLNAPNDLWVHPVDGYVYFTDPWYPRTWWDRGPQENPPAVYRYDPADDSLVQVIDDLQQPNGIIGTPDGRVLYVADIDGGITFAYDIADGGVLENPRVFCRFGSDGMTIDSENNVYLTTGANVEVFDSAGEHIASIEVPEAPANVAFGGADRKTLFITARTGLYALRMRVHGVGPQ